MNFLNPMNKLIKIIDLIESKNFNIFDIINFINILEYFSVSYFKTLITVSLTNFNSFSVKPKPDGR